MRVQLFVRRFLWTHVWLLLFLVLSSIVAAIVYELVHGGDPWLSVKDSRALDLLDRQGDKPREVWKDDEFECLGWKATHECDPYGPRDYARDRACDTALTRVSGYCEVRNRTSGEIHRVMLSTCKSWRWPAIKQSLTCNDAWMFTDYSILAQRYEHPTSQVLPSKTPAPKTAADRWPTRGISMIAYPKVIAGVYSIVRTLRYHGCSLLVEIWINPMEMRASHSILQALVTEYNVIVRTIQDPNASKFHAKPYAVYHSHFEQVLFLDSDNIPVRDPTYLFDSPEFQQYGAIFWPDFWRPAVRTPFNVHAQSVLWDLLDMPFIDMFEQESGQLLINRRTSEKALNKLMFYSSRTPRLLTDWSLIYGDKDLFRLAWLNTSTPFYYIPHILALGGLYDAEEDFFCGVAMIQRDPNGDFIFMHRNQAKLNGRRDQRVLLTHLQKFTASGDAFSLSPRELEKYRVRSTMDRLGQHSCFSINPITPTGDATPFLVQSLETTRFPQMEQQAIHFSIEGRSLVNVVEEREIALVEEAILAENMGETSRREANQLHEDRVYLALKIAGGLLLLCVLTRCRSSRAKRSSPVTASAVRTNSASLGVSIVEVDETSASSSALAEGSSFRRKKSISVHEDPYVL